MDPKKIKIGLLGFGTVGQGVWKVLEAKKAKFLEHFGLEIEIQRIFVRNPHKKREIAPPAHSLTMNADDILNDPNIDIVCELMGGVELAKELTLKALVNKKPIITANKAVICEHGKEIFRIANEHETPIFFEASVAGGIPIIKVLREGLAANSFPSIYGILNGTSNYILTRMERESLSFEETIADARLLGYVEADEALDLDGIDAAHKTAILAYMAHGKWISPSEMIIDGIRNISQLDIRFARECGYKIKLLAKIEANLKKNLISASVCPTFVPINESIASVDEVYNGITLIGDVVGKVMLTGRGAGMNPTASAVVSDIIDCARLHCAHKNPYDASLGKENSDIALCPPENIFEKFYLRLSVADKTGTLAEICKSLSNNDISVATMKQLTGPEEGTATLLLTLHQASEQSMQTALHHLKELPIVLDNPFLARIMSTHH